MGNKPLTIVIIGPTAIGKSNLAHDLAMHLGADIISMDSAQVYRQLCIGTDKPSEQMQQQVNYHLVDRVDFWQNYDVGCFIEDCHQCLNAIHAINRPAIICGGTLFYFIALLQGLSALPSADWALRAQLKQHSNQRNHQYLQKLDADSAARIHVNDSQRVIRALEINLLTGAPVPMKLTTKAALDIDKLIVLKAK